MRKDNERERRFGAIAVSRGVGVGRIVFLAEEVLRPERTAVGDVDMELDRFRSAVEASAAQLHALTLEQGANSKPIADIFGVQLLILEQSSLLLKIEKCIVDHKVNAEWAIKQVVEGYMHRHAEVEEPHIREKQLDIDDVGQRLLRNLSGATAGIGSYADSVVVAHELTPSAVVRLARNAPSALVAERGGWTSHSSILAREFELPMVAGLRDARQILIPGVRAMVDGIEGEVIVYPSEETLAKHSRSAGDGVTVSSELTTGAIATIDGTEITLRANADTIESHRTAANYGAQGIGLFRSESLIERLGLAPSEDDQTAFYSNLARAAHPYPLRIRTFDTDRAHMSAGTSPREPNPSLGLRSIRLSLVEQDVFRAQLRSIARAAKVGNVEIIIPMVSAVDEIDRSIKIIREESERIGIEKPLAIGAMIEVPSAILTIDEIASRVDFLCLGTNDLVQYLLAVDRDNEAVADWYQTLHPAVIAAIRMTVRAAGDHGIALSVCGEMAGSPFYIPLLLGLGVRELSMNVTAIHPVRRLVRGITVNGATELASKLEALTTTEEIEKVLRAHYRSEWADLFPPGLLDEEVFSPQN